MTMTMAKVLERALKRDIARKEEKKVKVSPANETSKEAQARRNRGEFTAEELAVYHVEPSRYVELTKPSIWSGVKTIRAYG